jgi:TM2 domain-containing membrane protein YozV
MFALLELLYLVWMIGAVVVFARGLSQMLFGKVGAGSNAFFRAIFMAVIWPIALLTPEGRAALRAMSRSD